MDAINRLFIRVGDADHQKFRWVPPKIAHNASENRHHNQYATPFSLRTAKTRQKNPKSKIGGLERLRRLRPPLLIILEQPAQSPLASNIFSGTLIHGGTSALNL